jgi:hypothetical protein
MEASPRPLQGPGRAGKRDRAHRRDCAGGPLCATAWLRA